MEHSESPLKKCIEYPDENHKWIHQKKLALLLRYYTNSRKGLNSCSLRIKVDTLGLNIKDFSPPSLFISLPSRSCSESVLNLWNRDATELQRSTMNICTRYWARIICMSGLFMKSVRLHLHFQSTHLFYNMISTVRILPLEMPSHAVMNRCRVPRLRWDLRY